MGEIKNQINGPRYRENCGIIGIGLLRTISASNKTINIDPDTLLQFFFVFFFFFVYKYKPIIIHFIFLFVFCIFYGNVMVIAKETSTA